MAAGNGVPLNLLIPGTSARTSKDLKIDFTDLTPPNLTPFVAKAKDMSTDKAAKDLAKQLRNVGPKLASKMIAAGIDSPEKLRQLGAKKAFEIMYRSGDAYGDFNAAYLYALEGAILDCDWLDISEETKNEYKRYAQKLQSKKLGKRG